MVAEIAFLIMKFLSELLSAFMHVVFLIIHSEDMDIVFESTDNRYFIVGPAEFRN
jgi:hypothetical protein